MRLDKEKDERDLAMLDSQVLQDGSDKEYDMQENVTREIADKMDGIL